MEVRILKRESDWLWKTKRTKLRMIMGEREDYEWNLEGLREK